MHLRRYFWAKILRDDCALNTYLVISITDYAITNYLLPITKTKEKTNTYCHHSFQFFSMSASVSSHLTCCLMKRHLDSLKSIILSIYWICRQNVQSIVGSLKLILSLYTSFVLERVAYFRCLQQRLHVTYMLCDGILYYKV